MPRVVPSQVVRFIKENDVTHAVSLNSAGAPELSAILQLVGQIPDELLTMDNETYSSLIKARAEIKDILETWTANRNGGHTLQRFNLNQPGNPLVCIRDALEQCPDESPAPGTSELIFITDEDLRTNLRNDIGAINRALSNGEWKAATVLAGSTIEAVLLWALQRNTTAATAAATALRTSGELTRQPDASLERWDLHEYTEVAANLGIIEPGTATDGVMSLPFDTRGPA